MLKKQQLLFFQTWREYKDKDSKNSMNLKYKKFEVDHTKIHYIQIA